MQDVIELYLFALRSGDRPLATALARALRAAPRLRAEADRSLQQLPRAGPRWSAGTARVVNRLAFTLR
jgi:hypothetical protein